MVKRRRKQKEAATAELGSGALMSGPRPGLPLLKQRSWSPDSDREDTWRRRKGLHRARCAAGRSVTDDDLDELRGCIDLGFGFDFDSPAERLSQTLPALDLLYAVRRNYNAGSSPDRSSAGGSPAGSPVSFFSPGESPDAVKARLKQWAQVVACSLRQHP